MTPALKGPQDCWQSLAAQSQLMRDSGVGIPNHNRWRVRRNDRQQEESHASGMALRGSCFEHP
jgi:hypothetical protein